MLRNLRINKKQFIEKLLYDEGKVIGSIDSRYTGVPQDNPPPFYLPDPSMTDNLGLYSATLNTYFRKELKYENDLPYEFIAIPSTWNHTNGNAPQSLVRGMIQNDDLRVWVASSYYDLSTPFSITDYAFRHMGLPAEAKERISFTYYAAGHMMYLEKISLEKLKDDAVVFYGNVMAINSPAFSTEISEKAITGANISLYPNPIKDVINIDIGTTCKNATVQVSNISGQVVLEKDFTHVNNIKLTTEELEKGFYFITIQTDENKSNTFKVVKL